MKIATKYHNELTVETKDIIRFENGIPGFNEETQFVILPFSDDNFFSILQSITTPQLAFVIINPFHFFKEYDFELPSSVVEKLAIESEKDVIVYTILTVNDTFEDSTANLQAPVVINGKKQTGKQVVLTEPTYHTKHQLFPKKTSTRQEV